MNADRIFWAALVALLLCLAAAGHPRMQNGLAAAGIVLFLVYAWMNPRTGNDR